MMVTTEGVSGGPQLASTLDTEGTGRAAFGEGLIPKTQEGWRDFRGLRKEVRIST